MQLRPEQLDAHLKGTLSPLYVLHGNEPLLVIEAADAIRTVARARGFGEREVLVVTQYFKWSALAEAAGNLSLFGGDKLIDLRIPTGKPGREGSDALARYAASPPAGTLTLVTLPLMDWKARKSAWFSALLEHGAEIELNAPGPERLPAWLAGRLARQQQSATPEALDFMAGHVEGNLLAANQEVMKLALLHPPGELSLEQVRNAVMDVARYDVDDLRQALLAGDAARASRLLDGLRAEGVAAPLLLWIVVSELRLLAAVRAEMDAGRSADDALAASRIFGARQLPYKRALQRVSSGVARTALMQAARLDRMIKGVARGDVWDEFLQIALRLCAR
ncbi:DNA polymerase III subunit delta [Methyloversatilis sp.]|uniref:DNA polymerase III subunit delta n=1 Tax=Methyloversatilis sp. TaxID=2569862 RepID=UPI0035B0EC09